MLFPSQFRKFYNELIPNKGGQINEIAFLQFEETC